MWKTFSRVLPWIPQSLFLPEICPGMACVLKASFKGSSKSCGPICFLSIQPLAQVPASHTEDKGSVGSIELESHPYPIHPEHVNRRLLWPELHLSNLPSHKQLSTHWGSTAKVQWVTSQGQWWLWVDLTAQTYPGVQQALYNPVPLDNPATSPFCRGFPKQDQRLLWVSRADLSFKEKRSGHLAPSIYI